MDLILKAITYNLIQLCRLFSGSHPLIPRDEKQAIEDLLLETYRLFLMLEKEHQVTHAELAPNISIGRDIHYSGTEFQQTIQEKCAKIFRVYLNFRDSSYASYPTIGRTDVRRVAAAEILEIAKLNNDFEEDKLDQEGRTIITGLCVKLNHYAGYHLPRLKAPAIAARSRSSSLLLLTRSTPMQEAIITMVSHFDAMLAELKKDAPDANVFDNSLSEIANSLWELSLSTENLELVEENEGKLIAKTVPKFPANKDTDPDLRLLDIVFELFKFSHALIDELKQSLASYESILKSIKSKLPKTIVLRPQTTVLRPPVAAASIRMSRAPLSEAQRRTVRHSVRPDEIAQLAQWFEGIPDVPDLAAPYKEIIEQLNKEDAESLLPATQHVAGVSRYDNFKSYIDTRFPFYSANCLSNFMCVAEGPRPINASVESQDHALRFFVSTFLNPFFENAPIKLIIVAGRHDEANGFLYYYDISQQLVLAGRINNTDFKFVVSSHKRPVTVPGNINHYQVTVNDGLKSNTIRLLHLPNFKDFDTTSLTDDDVVILYNAYKDIERANQNLLIHCAAGRGRSGTLALAILLANNFDNYYNNAGEPLLDRIQELLQSLRRIRPGLVQTGKQLMMAVDLAKRFHAIDLKLLEEARIQRLVSNADRANEATEHFTLGRDNIDQRLYSSWYSDRTLRYLMHLHYSNQRDAVAYVFETQYKKGFSLAEQLAALAMFKNKERRGRACFILTEPNVHETSHYIFGVLTDNVILLINPTGISDHPDFYAQLNNIQVAQVTTSRKIYMSRDVLQRDEHGLVSCGPIAAELAIAFATISAEQLERALEGASSTSENREDGTGSSIKFNIINLVDLNRNIPCLTDSLQQVLRVETRHYKSKMEDLRRAHLESLRQKKPVAWDSLYNAPAQIAIAKHCAGEQPIFQQGGGYDPLQAQLLKSNRPIINCAIEFIFLCIESFNIDSRFKFNCIVKTLMDLNQRFNTEFKLFHEGRLRSDPIVQLQLPDNQSPHFRSLFLAFCNFIAKSEYRQTLIAELPQMRALFERSLINDVYNYAKENLRIEEAQLQFLMPTHSRSVTLAAASPASNRLTTVFASVPAVASPAKSKDRSKIVIKQTNIDPTYCYDDWDITTVRSAVIVRSRLEGGEIGDFANNRHYLLNGLNADGTFNDDETHERFFVAVTPSVMCIPPHGFECTPIDYFFDKARQIGHEHDRRDIFDELVSVVRTNINCAIKILFPFNANSSFHWLLGEVQIHQRKISDDQVAIVVDIYAHDPFGRGMMPNENYQTLCRVIQNKLNEIYRKANIQPPQCTFNQKISHYERRQSSDDSRSCGVIVIDDMRLRILGHSLNGRLFPAGAVDLRQKQLDDVSHAKHAIVAESVKEKFNARATGAPSAKSKSKIEPRSMAYTIDNMNTVIEATKKADLNAGGLTCNLEDGCTYLLRDIYPEHKSDDSYQVAILPAITLNTMDGDPAHAMPIDTYLDRTKNVDACVKYLLNTINNAITAKRHSLNHIQTQKLEAFKLMMEMEPYKSLVIDPVIKDRVFEEAHAILTDRNFNQEKLASLTDLEEIEKHADVFEDLQQLFNTKLVCNVKILFPLRLLVPEDDGEVMRNLLVEVRIKRNNQDVNIDIWAHDPRGKGLLPPNIYHRLAGCIQGKLVHILPDARVTISHKQNPSPFDERRVARGDRSTAPAIVVEELFCRTRGEALTKSYPATAVELRKQHAARVAKLDTKAKNRKTFLRHQIILHTTKTGFGLQMEQVKPVTADGKLNLAYVVYKLRGICKELLNDPVDQSAVDRKFAKVITAFMTAQNNCTPNDAEQLVFFNADGSAKNPPSISTENPIRDRVIAGCFDIYQLLYIISIQSLEFENRREVVRKILASLEKLQADSRKLLPPKKEFVKGPTMRVTHVSFVHYQDEHTGEVRGKLNVEKEITGVLRRTRIDSIKRWGGIVVGSAATLGIGWFLTAVVTQHFSLEAYVVAGIAVPLALFLIVLIGSIYMTRNCCLRPYTAQAIEGDRFSLFALQPTVQREVTERTALIGELSPPPALHATRTPIRTGIAVMTGQAEEEALPQPMQLPTLEDAEEGRVAERQPLIRARPQSLRIIEGNVQKTAVRLSGALTTENVMQSAKATAHHRMTILFPNTRTPAAAASSSPADSDLPLDWTQMLAAGDRSTLIRPVDPNLIAAVQRAAATLDRLRSEIGGSDPEAVDALDDLVDPEALVRAAARKPQ